MALLLRCAALGLVPMLLIPMHLGARHAFAGRARMRAPSRGSCGAGKDLVVQALERLRAESAQAELANADQLLKRASDLCSESGEAWYYRSLVEAKLGHAPVADYAMRQARMFPSDAMTEGLNPFVLATPKSKDATPLGPVRERWALIVGIGTFSDPDLDLQFTKSDAETFRDVLVSAKGGGFKPENVKLITNEEATLSGIKRGLNWLARSAKADDLAVVYVASHGSARDLDTAGANYIIVHDTDAALKTDPDALYATALPMVELSNAVATRLKSRRTAIFLDTCYSGGAMAGANKSVSPTLRNASVSKETLEHMGQGSGRIIFAASRTDQESLESESLKHGYFTYYLAEALRAHPEMQLSQVFEYVEQHVSEKVQTDYRLYGGRQQNPVMSRSEDTTDFALNGGTAGAVARLDRP